MPVEYASPPSAVCSHIDPHPGLSITLRGHVLDEGAWNDAFATYMPGCIWLKDTQVIRHET